MYTPKRHFENLEHSNQNMEWSSRVHCYKATQIARGQRLCTLTVTGYNVRIFLNDRECSVATSPQPWKTVSFVCDFQRHKQEIAHVKFILKNKLNYILLLWLNWFCRLRIFKADFCLFLIFVGACKFTLHSHHQKDEIAFLLEVMGNPGESTLQFNPWSMISVKNNWHEVCSIYKWKMYFQQKKEVFMPSFVC